MGLRLIQLEEENKQLRMQNGNIKQSTYTDYSISQPELLSKVSENFHKKSQPCEDQIMNEMQTESGGSFGKATVSSEPKSPNNSENSRKSQSEIDSHASCSGQHLATIHENSEENLSVRHTRAYLEGYKRSPGNIHRSLQTRDTGPKNESAVEHQAGFMFKTDGYEDRDKGSDIRNRDNTKNVFLKRDHDIDIEIETEKSGQTKSNETFRTSRFSDQDVTDEVIY